MNHRRFFYYSALEDLMICCFTTQIFHLYMCFLKPGVWTPQTSSIQDRCWKIQIRYYGSEFPAGRGSSIDQMVDGLPISGYYRFGAGFLNQPRVPLGIQTYAQNRIQSSNPIFKDFKVGSP